MAQIGHGYGSEWQLLRMLGHHRNYFEKLLREQIQGLDGNIVWLDYPFNKRDQSISGDSEYLNLNFLYEIPFISDKEKQKAQDDWNSFKATGQSWDGIFYANNKLYLVEAKARIGEIGSSGNRKTGDIIRDCMFEIQKGYVTEPTDWENTKYYQLANRLSAAIFLNKHDINTSVVNIYFLNGYSKKIIVDGKCILVPHSQKSVKDEKTWKRAIEKECEALNLNEKGKALVHSVFVDCKIPNESASDNNNQD